MRSLLYHSIIARLLCTHPYRIRELTPILSCAVGNSYLIQTAILSCAVGNSFLIRWEFVFDSDAELIMRRWEFVFDSDAVQQYGNMELCCACAWLLSNERELVNSLARGVNIIAFGICKECFTG